VIEIERSIDCISSQLTDILKNMLPDVAAHLPGHLEPQAAVQVAFTGQGACTHHVVVRARPRVDADES
jgi:hypothetical protein